MVQARPLASEPVLSRKLREHWGPFQGKWAYSSRREELGESSECQRLRMGLECGPKSDAKSFKMREAEHGWQIQNGDSLTPSFQILAPST